MGTGSLGVAKAAALGSSSPSLDVLDGLGQGHVAGLGQEARGDGRDDGGSPIDDEGQHWGHISCHAHQRGHHATHAGHGAPQAHPRLPVPGRGSSGWMDGWRGGWMDGGVEGWSG